MALWSKSIDRQRKCGTTANKALFALDADWNSQFFGGHPDQAIRGRSRRARWVCTATKSLLQ
jgi:hypothetical protein